LKGLCFFAHELAVIGEPADRELGRIALEALFTTVTNVNFDEVRIGEVLAKTMSARDRAGVRYVDACRKKSVTPKHWDGAAIKLAGSVDEMIAQASMFGLRERMTRQGKDITGLQEMLVYGLKGMAAYADHAMVLGCEDDAAYAFIHEALALVATGCSDANELVRMNLRCGEVNLKVMAMLDGAHTSTFGHPVPTSVRIEPLKGKAILVSGHDLKDLEELLKQTEGTGIKVYTHGEMLPAHGYPGLKKYKHLAGNYSGAWQDQAKEFDAFPGAILMTTNCIQKPRPSYAGRLFTSGLVAWPGVVLIAQRNFKPLIEAALAAPGFDKDGADRTILVGFGHNAVMGVAGKVIDAVKAGKIKHFLLVGGCDGAKSGRNYFTQLVEKSPKDTVVLTLACGKYRFNKLQLGDIDGIPRLLDVGQCNDAYSAVQIAVALANAFGTDVNGLPLSLVISWYEQKAVAVLLTLLHLGIKNIRLGPSLPAFITPDVLKVLVDHFNVMPIGDADADLKSILS
jgi:hydroxylamine reductase